MELASYCPLLVLQMGKCQVTECGRSIDAFCEFLAHRKPIIDMVSATFIIAHNFFLHAVSQPVRSNSSHRKP